MSKRSITVKRKKELAPQDAESRQQTFFVLYFHNVGRDERGQSLGTVNDTFMLMI